MIPQTVSQKREILADVLRSFAQDTPLMRAFRETFEFRRKISWLGEGKNPDDLPHSLVGALCTLLAGFYEPSVLPENVAMVPVDAEFLEAFTQAIDQIPNITIDRYFFLIDRRSVPGDGKERIADVVLGCLQDYIRNGRARGALDPGS